MVLAAALISLAVIVPPADPQSAAPPSPPPQSAVIGDAAKPYSVEGVRKASAAGTRPSVDTTLVERDHRGYRMALESRAVTPNPCSLAAAGCGPTWQVPSNPTWHDQFLTMTGPQNYSVPYSGMSNSEKAMAVATSIGIGLALQAVTSLIQGKIVKISADRKQKKVEKVRAEIRTELEELERLNAAARASGATPIR